MNEKFRAFREDFVNTYAQMIEDSNVPLEATVSRELFEIIKAEKCLGANVKPNYLGIPIVVSEAWRGLQYTVRPLKFLEGGDV
ncbi:MAG: hypothetical protein RR394_09730 [Oscillospiraceae bacterium]